LEIFTTRKAVSEYLSKEKTSGKTIGFVPTMGALHPGHLSLIREASKTCDCVVVSIFVNPTQFNDVKDLENYPRPLEADLEKLRSVKCDILFMPEVKEMYQENEAWAPELGGLDTVLEGKQRPGHYQGVTQIVKKLLDVVKPDVTFFGQKDYQQFLIISKMVSSLGLSTQLVMCPIIREQDGLAMSSRNIHLSPAEHQTALVLSQVLEKTKSNFGHESIGDLKNKAVTLLEATPGLKLEYFEICNGDTLQPAVLETEKSIIALVAALVGATRLIDNIILK
jgi:pantoate--beta-alanine ligase